jgi:hypothetical protein
MWECFTGLLTRALSGKQALPFVPKRDLCNVALLFLIFGGSVGLWMNGLVTLAETVQGGEMDALVSLLREKVDAYGCFRALANCFVTRYAGITIAHGGGGGRVGAEELLNKK